MTDQITHSGEIIAISGHDVTISLRDSAALTCGSCRLASLCTKTDNRGTITVTVDSTRNLHTGMTVKAAVSERSQGIAVIWSLFMPLILFTAVIIPLSASQLMRWAVVLIAVGAVGIYDLLLWRFGPKLSRSIKWTIIPD